MNRAVRLAAMFTAVCVAAPATAQDLSGFGELRTQAELGVDGTWWQVVERFRPTYSGHIGERMRLVTTVELGMAQGRTLQTEFQRAIDGSDFGPLLDLAGCEWPEKGVPALNIDGIDDVLSIERFYLDIYLSWMDLRVGRQSLTWGSALMLNPTDPFPELLVAEPWRPRRGLDAARAIIPLPANADLTAVVGTNNGLDAFRAAGRLRLDVAGTDVALVGAFRSDGGDDGDGIVGLDVRGTFEVGYWLESAVHLGGETYTEFAVGVDYSFPVLDMLVVSAQYYRSGAGDADGGVPAVTGGLSTAITPPDCGCATGDAMGDPAAALFGGAQAEADPFAPLLSGRDYLLFAANLGFEEDYSASLFFLPNLGDGTAMLIPTITANALDWLVVSLSARLTFDMDGGGGEFHPDPDDLKLAADLGPAGTLEADFSGLVPVASITAWARASF